jgi:hypothetical protein
LDAPFNGIGYFFVSHITSKKFIISKFVTFNVWGSTNFVDFVEKKEQKLQLIVLGKTKTKNSLANGVDHCMAYKPEMN